MSSTAETPDVSAGHLSRALALPLRTARRYIARRRMPFALAFLWRVLIEGDLGQVSDEWRGWTLARGELISPEGIAFRPGEVLSIPIRQQQLAHLKLELAEPRQLDFLSGRRCAL